MRSTPGRCEARRTLRVALAAAAVVAGCVTGCSSASQGSAPAASSPVATPTAPASTPSASTAGAATDLGYRVAFTPRTDRFASPGPGESTYPRVAVTGGSDQGVRDAVRRVLEQRIEEQRSDFTDTVQSVLSDRVPDGDQTGGDENSLLSTQEIRVGEEVRWGWLYAVRLDVYRSVAGAAHPSDWYVIVVADWRTGRQVDITDLYPSEADLRQADTAVRRSLRGKYPDLTVDELTVAPVPGPDSDRHLKSYPTPSGLRVVVDRCQVGCVYGAFEVAVPWSGLPSPRTGSVPAASGS